MNKHSDDLNQSPRFIMISLNNHFEAFDINFVRHLHTSRSISLPLSHSTVHLRLLVFYSNLINHWTCKNRIKIRINIIKVSERYRGPPVWAEYLLIRTKRKAPKENPKEQQNPTRQPKRSRGEKVSLFYSPLFDSTFFLSPCVLCTHSATP